MVFFLFGENRVQEAIKKFNLVKQDYKNLSLHLIGPLQSNKAVDALKVFDCIQSIDREKIAKIISQNINYDWCKTKNFFIQINIGNEIQKSGIPVSELDPFYNYCVNEIDLKVIGLMVIPPIDENTGKYFKSLNELTKSPKSVADPVDVIKILSMF